MKRFKKVLKIAGITIGALFVLLVIVGLFAPKPTVVSKPVTKVETVVTPQQKYKAWVDGQFSLIDGSQIQLVKQVKADLNDSKSFKHLKTTYTDYKTYLIVYMEYSAKNQYNATIQTSVKAKSDYKTNTVTILPQ